MNKAFNIYRKFAKDADKELVHGAKFIIDEETDCYIRVKRCVSRNKEWLKAQAELAKKLGDRDDDDSIFLRHKSFIETNVTGWNNVADEKGELLPFTTDTAIKVLTDLPDLLDEIIAFSLDGDNYNIDDTVKN